MILYVNGIVLHPMNLKSHHLKELVLPEILDQKEIRVNLALQAY